MEELNAINENENIINTKILLYGDKCQKSFEKYYILNKTWFDNYKYSLKAIIYYPFSGHYCGMFINLE